MTSKNELKKHLMVELKRRRKELGLTQNEIAQRLGQAQSSWGHWEAGRRLPSLPNLCAVSNVLKCKLEDLLPGVDTEEQVIEVSRAQAIWTHKRYGFMTGVDGHPDRGMRVGDVVIRSDGDVDNHDPMLRYEVIGYTMPRNGHRVTYVLRQQYSLEWGACEPDSQYEWMRIKDAPTISVVMQKAKDSLGEVFRSIGVSPEQVFGSFAELEARAIDLGVTERVWSRRGEVHLLKVNGGYTFSGASQSDCLLAAIQMGKDLKAASERSQRIQEKAADE